MCVGVGVGVSEKVLWDEGELVVTWHRRVVTSVGQ